MKYEKTLRVDDATPFDTVEEVMELAALVAQTEPDALGIGTAVDRGKFYVAVIHLCGVTYVKRTDLEPSANPTNRDTARMDWLEAQDGNPFLMDPGGCICRDCRREGGHTVRQCIDYLMNKGA